MLSQFHQAGRIALLRTPKTMYLAPKTMPVLLMKTAIRSLSSESPSVEKARRIFREYRKNNFPEELPSRVWKEVLEAADVDKDGYITVEEGERILEKIGVADQMTIEELAQAMADIGAVDGRIEVEVLKGVLHDKRGLGSTNKKTI